MCMHVHCTCISVYLSLHRPVHDITSEEFDLAGGRISHRTLRSVPYGTDQVDVVISPLSRN